MPALTRLPVGNSCSLTDEISELCKAFNAKIDRVSILREAINRVDCSDRFRQALTEQFVPILVAREYAAPDESGSITERYAVMLCKKLVARTNCDALVSIRDFIAFIHQAMLSKHVCISRVACDTMMMLVAYAPTPETVLCSKEIDTQTLSKVAVDSLTSVTDGNSCLNAIRVLTLLDKSTKLALLNPLKLCENMVETFYNTTIPFVSKQTAGLILLFTDQDILMKQDVVRILREQADESKPTKASRRWQEVNDVLAFASN